MQEVRDAISKAKDFIDDNDVFAITEKGRAYFDHDGGEDTPPF